MPLLLLTALVAGSKLAQWSFAFYLLALLFNYPHFMATAYRAYRSYDELTCYRFYTLHVALLLACAGVVVPRKVPQWHFRPGAANGRNCIRMGQRLKA